MKARRSRTLEPVLLLLAAVVCCLAATAAVAVDPHVEAVIRTVEAAKGEVEKTADGESLRLVDLAVPNTGPHDHRKEDPYDAAFVEHLGHVTTLESLTFDKLPPPDERLPALGPFARLKTISFALRPQGYPPETQAKVRAILPQVDVKFVK